MLRTRLFLYLIPFVLLLLGVGIAAVALFSRLASNVDVTFTENYRSVIAAQKMSAALGRMKDNLRWASEADRISATNSFANDAAEFESNLAYLIEHRDLIKEQKLIEQLQSSYQSFHAAGLSILKFDQRRDQRQAFFEKNVLEPLAAMDVLLDEIRRLNHENILTTSQDIREIKTHITRLMILAMIVAGAITALAGYRLGKSILRPIQLLTQATREVGRGNLDQIVPVVSPDELGELATAFNKMAGQLREYRQSTSEQIIRLHRTMESALASFPDPIFILDREGRIELKNPAAQDFSARLQLNDTLPARLTETAAEVVKQKKDFLPHSFTEVLSFRFDGEEKSFLPRILGMRGEAGVPVGVAVVLHDVTRFRLLDDAKTNLVATVSHELKTPLTSVRMVLHLLLEKSLGPLNRKQNELLETARKESERLLRILNDLLDLTRLESGQSGLNKEPTSPGELVQRLCDEVKQRVLDQGLILSCSVEPHLPPVLIDQQRISHVFHNLISNAIKHSPARGEITVRATRNKDGDVEFTVSDQGPGVPEEFQVRIFDRFFRVPGQGKSGAGLGLSIAREIVVAHGGRIGVRSQPNKGSEFCVVLPAAESAKVQVSGPEKI